MVMSDIEETGIEALIEEGRKRSAVVDNYEGKNYLIRRLTDELERACRALAALAETEVKSTPTEFNQIGMTLSFFASAIKSGENWTATCQREYDAAQACLTQLRSALVSPESRS